MMLQGSVLGSLSGALAFLLFAGWCDDARAAKRSFTIAAVEPKGGTTVDKEPFPKDALPEGGGYILRKPDQTGRWEVSTYVWTPSQIVVTEGGRSKPRVHRHQRGRASNHNRRLRQGPAAQARPRHKSRVYGRQSRHVPDHLCTPQAVDGGRAHRLAEAVATSCRRTREGWVRGTPTPRSSSPVDDLDLRVHTRENRDVIVVGLVHARRDRPHRHRPRRKRHE